MRAHVTGALLLLTLASGCEVEGRLPVVVDQDAGPDGSADASGDAGQFVLHPLRVFQFNLGNTDHVWGGPCPAYHEGTQCDRSVEQELTKFFTANLSAGEIVVLNGVWDQDRCKGQSESDTRLLCHNHAGASPYQQVRRLLGSSYTIVCDDRTRSSCVGVRRGTLASGSTLEVDHCAAGALCTNAKTPPLPAACASIKGLGGVSAVYLKLRPGPAYKNQDPVGLVVVNVHAFAGPSDLSDPAATACRLAQYQQAFQLAASQGRALLAGDIGSDPRLLACKPQDVAHWCTKVGPGKAFAYHTVSAVTRVRDFIAVDVVASNFLGGKPCTVYDDNSGPSTTMWKSLDHRPLLCPGLGLALGGAPTCGDSRCEAPEDCLTCQKDCGKCTCGDGSCDATKNETCISCISDCDLCGCGDGSCDPSRHETCATCPSDCGQC